MFSYTSNCFGDMKSQQFMMLCLLGSHSHGLADTESDTESNTVLLFCGTNLSGQCSDHSSRARSGSGQCSDRYKPKLHVHCPTHDHISYSTRQLYITPLSLPARRVQAEETNYRGPDSTTNTRHRPLPPLQQTGETKCYQSE